MQNNNLVLGLLAHVDAGKTTLAESILYLCGKIRTLGRVDHRDTLLDNNSLERDRGITIFSKQAQVCFKEKNITLLDTPGHVDFSAEMERTLQVLDYAVLVISGADGVQGHVQTLWRLLKRYEIPVFLFVNKMDQPGTDRKKLLKELQVRLDANCVEFDMLADRMEAETQEQLSLCDERMLEEYLEKGEITVESIAEAVESRHVFPCYFGSALRQDGVELLLQGIETYARCPRYPEEFGARVFKISRDAAGKRLTYLKVTGGSLRVKMPVNNYGSAGEAEEWEEKADQLRIYNGAQYEAVEQVDAGGVCAVTGLTRTFAGQGLGREEKNGEAVLEPVLTYQVLLPEGSDAIKVLGQFRQLEEEDPQLHILWKEEFGEIHVQVMGEVQIEILKSLIEERFGLVVEFGQGSIVYKETIAGPVEGVGHFEPLRHYAEVHLLMTPGERGSGVQIDTLCSEDMLDRNWQRLILTHLEEKVHAGVLTGSALTDIHITLIAGRAHQKHTEGGDFRQATYRAVRQGLKKAQNVLLEPCFSYRLEVPSENIGRAMSDIQRMNGSFEPPFAEGEMSVLTGRVPVAAMQDYQREVNAYTRGHGRLFCTLDGYIPCHNAEEIITQMDYDSEADLSNPTGSVFCAHGAGFIVNWDEVDSYAHVECGLWKKIPGLSLEETDTNMSEALSPINQGRMQNGRNQNSSAGSGYITQEEIEEIFERTYGKKPVEQHRYRRYHRQENATGGSSTYRAGDTGISTDNAANMAGSGWTNNRMSNAKKEEYLLVDGYNIIFAWEELRELAAVNIDSARDRLMDICSNYQGYMGCTLILVYDAYKVKGNPGSVQKYHNIYVVYTKEAETADQYIEKTVHEMGKKCQITVATSDALEQMIIWGGGAIRLSARGFKEAVDAVSRDMRELYLKQ